MAKKKSNQNKQASKKRVTAKKHSKKNLYIIALAIALFGFALYTNTLSHGYVLDDFSQIKENFVTKQGIEGIATQWTTHARYGYRPGAGELYRPIPMSMFSLEWELAPDNPFWPHLINVLLYALTGALLFLTLARIWKKRPVLLPLLTTLFFIAHPVHVEVVANIKSRDEIVMFLMCLLTLNFLWRHVEKEDIKYYIASLFTYLIALFSKENSVTFLAIFPLFIYFFSNKKLNKILALTAPYVVLAAIFIFIRSKVIGAFDNPSEVSVLDNFIVLADDVGTRVATAFLLLGKYSWSLIFPHPLSNEYGYNQIPLAGFGNWKVVLSLVLWLGMGIYAVLKINKKNLWSFAILFFIINFSIFSNLVLTIGTSYGDRLLYSASPAFAMALTMFLMKILGDGEVASYSNFSMGDVFKNKKIWAAAAVILILYSAKTITRNQVWESSYTLYKADIPTAPNSAKLNFHYGLELVKKGNDAPDDATRKQWYDQAKQHFFKAIEILPAYHDALGQLGLAFYREKDYPKSLEYYQKALKSRPHFPLVYSNMGTLYSDMGNRPEARKAYEKAVEQDPRMVPALRNLGALHAQEGRFEEAIKYFQQGLQYEPDNVTLIKYLGMSLRDSGQPDKAQPYLEKAAQMGN